MPHLMEKRTDAEVFISYEFDVTELMEYAKKNIAKYAVPKEIEFRKSFPQTLVGKVAFRILEEEESGKNAET